MRRILLLILISGAMFPAVEQAYGQTCAAPADNQTVNGTDNRWLAYFYRNENLTSYHGRVTYGDGTSPDIDLDFQGADTDYDPSIDPQASANNFVCGINTERFSVRLRLKQIFTAGVYDFIVGSNDGVRLLIDGLPVINQWNDHNYTEYKYSRYLPAGNHTLTLEYYDKTGENRLKFQMRSDCTGNAGIQTAASGTQWQAYLYQGTNFNTYKGSILLGTPNLNYFETDFGGDAVLFRTNECAVYTEYFSARFLQRRHIQAGTYLFTVGGDDGYRLSIDGGNTWIINEWYDHAIQTTAVVVNIPTARDIDLVLEYYDINNGNVIMFDIGVTLPVKLTSFEARYLNNQSILYWQTSNGSTEDHFEIERSSNGKQYTTIGKVNASAAAVLGNGNRKYAFTDAGKISNTAFYRLKIVDKSGSEEYSNIVTINPDREGKVKVYPTFVYQSKELFIRAERKISHVKTVVTNYTGQSVFRKDLGTLTEGQVITLPLQQALASRGTYLVQIFSDGALIHKQTIIVQ